MHQEDRQTVEEQKNRKCREHTNRRKGQKRGDKQGGSRGETNGENSVEEYLAKKLGMDSLWFGYLQTTFGTIQLLGGPIFGRIHCTKVIE
nr:PREDICTED: uncharacterized protein LOC102360490 isoform X2 [Latimeria chalumnae]|eukprot:XP_014344862.1 PREDICTED: uncharacterized protein LOC102360490 isoform X2 [Latimeria chalumnae]